MDRGSALLYARHRVIHLVDSAFGVAPSVERRDRRSFLRYVLLTGVLVMLMCARRPDIILRPQIGGDGKVFFYPQVTTGFWQALTGFYGGFPFLGQRLVAVLGSLVPTIRVPLVYAASTLLITASMAATFSLPGFRHLVRSDGLRVAVCVGVVCIPASESLGLMGHLGYFFAIWLLFMSVIRTPRTFPGTAAWCMGGALAVLSAPLAPIFAPLWLFRGMRRDRRDRSFAATQLAAVAAVFGIYGLLAAGVLDGGMDRPVVPAIFSEWLPGYRWATFPALGWATASCVDAALVSDAAFNALERFGTVAVVVPMLLLVALIALGMRGVCERGRITVVVGIYVLIASLSLHLVAEPAIVLLLNGAVPNLHVGALMAIGQRHRAVPEVALLLVAAGMIDGAVRVRIRNTAAAISVAALLIAWVPAFRVPPLPDCQWPLWAARLDRKLASGSREPLKVPSCLPGFDMVFDAPPGGTHR